MKNGLLRFEFYLVKLEQLLVDARKENNPALFIYENNARTILFMLEALSRLYAGILHQKRFEKLKDYFKSLEDLLGAIDHYDSFAKEFLGHPLVPATATEYMRSEYQEKLQILNDLGNCCCEKIIIYSNPFFA